LGAREEVIRRELGKEDMAFRQITLDSVKLWGRGVAGKKGKEQKRRKDTCDDY